MEPDQLDSLLRSLFPDGGDEIEGEERCDDDDNDEDRRKTITDTELTKTIRRPGTGNPAPGLDDITAILLKAIPGESDSKKFHIMLSRRMLPRNLEEISTHSDF